MKTSLNISQYIDNIGDWRGQQLMDLRQLINVTDPELTEDFKWGVPVWTSNGLVCAISAFKNHVKINFFKGAYLPNPKGLFNSGLDSKEHRSINLAETDKLDKSALKALIKAAVNLNKK